MEILQKKTLNLHSIFSLIAINYFLELNKAHTLKKVFVSSKSAIQGKRSFIPTTINAKNMYTFAHVGCFIFLSRIACVKCS